MKKRTVGVLLAAFFAMALTGCGDKQPQPGEVKGYDKGEEYLSIWVHSIEDTEEGQCYRKSVDAFNKKYDGKYFADIEFIPRNDSGGGYSDKINATQEEDDYNGSAKVALLAVEISQNAWMVLRERLSNFESNISHLIVILEQLGLEIDHFFPKARYFKRPGFDC